MTFVLFGTLAGLAATALLKSGGSWQTAALYFGALPALLSGLCVLLARPAALPAPADAAALKLTVSAGTT